MAPSFSNGENQGIVIPPLQAYVRELRRKYPNLKISILALHFPFTSQPYEWNGCTVYPVNAANGNILLRPFYWLKAFRLLKKIHQTQTVDLVQSFWLHEPALIAQRFASKNQIPHVATLMGQEAKPSNRYLRFLSLASSQLVCLSEFQKAVFESHSPHPVNAVIPFGISDLDPDLLPPSKNRTIDLIAVSSLIPLKRMDLFIEAIEEVKKNLIDIQVLIVGKGILYDLLQQKIDDSGLSKNVRLTGQLDRKTCMETMNSSRIFVHTSVYEGQGYAVLEALAMGCEVVSMNESFFCTHPAFSYVKTKEALVSKILDLLNQKNVPREKVVPITMLETLQAYERLFQESGISFQ